MHTELLVAGEGLPAGSPIRQFNTTLADYITISPSSGAAVKSSFGDVLVSTRLSDSHASASSRKSAHSCNARSRAAGHNCDRNRLFNTTAGEAVNEGRANKSVDWGCTSTSLPSCGEASCANRLGCTSSPCWGHAAKAPRHQARCSWAPHGAPSTRCCPPPSLSMSLSHGSAALLPTRLPESVQAHRG